MRWGETEDFSGRSHIDLCDFATQKVHFWQVSLVRIHTRTYTSGSQMYMRRHIRKLLPASLIGIKSSLERPLIGFFCHLPLSPSITLRLT